MTPLHCASKVGRILAVEVLLELDADLNKRDALVNGG